jgi:type I restriction enzyme S subunit
MELMPGYKQTEIGVIPEDWEVNIIKSVFSFKQGFQCPVEKQSTLKTNRNVRFIRIIDVTQQGVTERYIDDPGSQYHVQENDLFMIRYGAPGVLGYGFSGVVANNMFRLIALNEIEPKYFYYLLQTQQISILNLSSSTTMAAINFQSLRDLVICYPTDIVEQMNIASCLSDIDSLITSIEKLIEKKKLIKKG